jgi:UDP-glucose 4-epimerase
VRTLVTGGAGFIGSHLVDALVARGDEVHVLDDLSSGARASVATEATLHVGSISDPRALRAACAAARPEVVFHLAAQIDVGRSVVDPAEDAATNIVGTLAVVAEAATVGARHLVFASTGGIYGDAERVPCPEEARERPLAPYGQSKLAAEGYLRLHSELHGLGVTALRFANVYGPRQDARREGGVVAILCESARAGAVATVFGDGRQTRDFLYVGDAVRALLAAADSRAALGPFNVGTGTETTINELAQRLGVRTRHAPARQGDVARSCLDATRATRELGWTPCTSLGDGLAQTMAWTRPEPAAVRTAEARRVLTPTLLLGVVVACLAAAGSSDEIADEAPLALFAMALGLPIAVATAVDWTRPARRLLRQALCGLALACVLLSALAVPGTGLVHAHPVLLLSLAASSLAAAAITLPAAQGVLRPRTSGG